MSPMLEKAARAVEDEGPVGCCTVSEKQALAIARAVLLAVREPEHGVVRAMSESAAEDGEGGRHAPLFDLIGFSGENATRLVVAEAYRAAIDHLVSTGEPS